MSTESDRLAGRAVDNRQFAAAAGSLDAAAAGSLDATAAPGSTDVPAAAGSPAVPAAPGLPEVPDVPADQRRPHRPTEGPTGRGGPVPGWLRFFGSEIRLVFGRPRNLALLGVLAVVPVFFGIVFRLTISAPTGPGDGPPFLNQLAGNGVFLTLVVLSLLLLLLLPLSVAVISGDAIAGEAGHGTLRGLLTVPAGRTRLLSVKYAVICVFSLAACLLVTVIALIMGLILFHNGPVTLLSGTTVSLGAGVLRVLLVTVYVAVALMSLGAVGLAASTLTQHPIGAIASALVLVIASEICDQVPQLAAIHAYLPTHFWLSWDGLFRSPIDWSGVSHGLVSFGVYAAIFCSVAWAKFTSADVTS